jgi:hypothetical protein
MYSTSQLCKQAGCSMNLVRGLLGSNRIAPSGRTPRGDLLWDDVALEKLRAVAEAKRQLAVALSAAPTAGIAS